MKNIFSVNDIINILKTKISTLERMLENNYQTEDFYVDIKSKIEILKELLKEIS